MQTYNIYYPEYNIENIIDFLDSKRRYKKESKKLTNITLNQSEILTTNCLSPIQRHQKQRTTIINSDLHNLNFKRAVNFKKIHTFLAEN